MMRSFLIAIAVVVASATVSDAAVVSWTDWTSSDLTTTTGTMGSVGVTFSTNGGGTLQFAQLGYDTYVGGMSVGGNPDPQVNYWIEGSPAPYTGNAVVDNAPTPYELLGFYNPSETNTLHFDVPVLNPLMAIVSMGQSNFPVTYSFDTPFSVLSEGLGFWGDGTYSVSGNTLEGSELHGVIQFQGLVSDIQWSSSAEYWHGFTVGYAEPEQSAPEPATTGLFLASLVGLAVGRRRRG